MSLELIKNIEDNINESQFFDGELKVGYLRNNIFNYNIRDNVFYGFKNFINKNNSATNIKQKVYQYYDLQMISKDENSHICFKLNENSKMNYITLLENKLSLRFKLNNSNIIDNIYFPCLEKYDNYEEQDIDRYSIKFKNSIVNIDFINNQNNIKSIIFKFQVDKNNYDNFKCNLSFILSKFYRTKINL